MDDCVAVARYLSSDDRPPRNGSTGTVGYPGRSAGGFTVLAALTFHDVFSAGASRYGMGTWLRWLPIPTSSRPATPTALWGGGPKTRLSTRGRSPIHQWASCPRRCCSPGV
ncbi:MAG: hypothetical protein Ct9H300mP12_10980 [Acidimicrobiales bacterium]|nr:MAG: hypothetical protein Ct9H300mP12_10980 [Acidimicrobiales bacterium]